MTDKLSLAQRICKGEGGAKSVDIAQMSEVLRVLADLFVNDPETRTQFWSEWEVPALARREGSFLKSCREHKRVMDEKTGSDDQHAPPPEAVG